MKSPRRHVVNALWALGLPFPIAAICTVAINAVLSRAPLGPEGTAPLGYRILVFAMVATPALGSAAGYVFAQRLFVPHALAVGIIYLPLMCYVLAWFSFWVQITVNGGL